MDLREYKGKFRNAYYWQKHAYRHYYAAQILYEHLEPYMKKDDIQSDEENEQFVSLWQSYFLLMGLAFENILKGLIISIEPDLENENEYEKKYNFSFKHNLEAMFEKNFRSLTIPEKELIDRLQSYLIWMSKYPVPKKSKISENTTKHLKFTDNECLTTLYQEIEGELKKNVELDPIRHWNASI
ncbi:MAG: hypothetical protein WCJ95_18865 [Mariniphaga sp.]